MPALAGHWCKPPGTFTPRSTCFLADTLRCTQTERMISKIFLASDTMEITMTRTSIRFPFCFVFFEPACLCLLAVSATLFFSCFSCLIPLCGFVWSVEAGWFQLLHRQRGTAISNCWWSTRTCSSPGQFRSLAQSVKWAWLWLKFRIPKRPQIRFFFSSGPSFWELLRYPRSP